MTKFKNMFVNVVLKQHRLKMDQITPIDIIENQTYNCNIATEVKKNICIFVLIKSGYIHFLITVLVAVTIHRVPFIVGSMLNFAEM